MSVTALNIHSGIPVSDGMYILGNGSGTALIINPGDYVAFSGQYVVAAEDALSYWKNSGVGIALDRNPKYDEYGSQIINTAVLIARRGVFRVSANFSGQPNLGVLAYPMTTGSAVNAPTGLTGVGALWGTATPARHTPQQITYDYKDLASAISAYVAGTATGSALLPGSGLLSANAVSAQVSAVAQVIGWYNSGPAGTGQMDIVLWDRNADLY